jgi:hypothetical protein
MAIPARNAAIQMESKQFFTKGRFAVFKRRKKVTFYTFKPYHRSMNQQTSLKKLNAVWGSFSNSG